MGCGISEQERKATGDFSPARGSVLLSTAEVGRGAESMFQAREAASEPPQMLPKMIGDHLAVRVNRKCLAVIA